MCSLSIIMSEWFSAGIGGGWGLDEIDHVIIHMCRDLRCLS
jgi:hypothetical protein